MDRLIDAAAVLLFAGATAFVALYARGVLTERANDTAAAETYAAHVARVLPRLEGHAAAGSMRDRALVCDERERLADIAAIERELGDGRDDPGTAASLATGIDALRACVACTPEPHGCANAARAFTDVERRLSLPRTASGI
jgi:hypothetical protein